jgi:hypothetical protein
LRRAPLGELCALGGFAVEKVFDFEVHTVLISATTPRNLLVSIQRQGAKNAKQRKGARRKEVVFNQSINQCF